MELTAVLIPLHSEAPGLLGSVVLALHILILERQQNKTGPLLVDFTEKTLCPS